MPPAPEADRATREACDVVAADDARLLPDMSVEAPLARAVLACPGSWAGSPGRHGRGRRLRAERSTALPSAIDVTTGTAPRPPRPGRLRRRRW